MPRLRSRSSAGESNILALFISALSLGGIFCSFDPVPAGEDPGAFRNGSQSDAVPLPPDVTPPSGAVISTADPVGETAGDVSASGVVLNNEEAICFSLLLLKDGARFLQNINTYAVTFDKQERISGDLGDSQTIEMKVRHSPTFSVYMKWKNGDTGRQVLYNEDYEDRKMVVKLGGLKGRLLPAIKLDPCCPDAMSEARYPCTEAGLLAMVRQIVMHREKDVARGEGVICQRLPNAVCDERSCFCFQFVYESPEFNETYRKSILMIDTRYHIPLQVVNYTWAKDVEGLGESALDEQTLVENYTFRNLDFGRQIVVEDFSRENPAYRM